MNEKTSRSLYLISNKIDFNLGLIKRGSKSLFILIKGIVHQEGIIILNIHGPNMSALKLIKQQISLNTLIVGVLNTQLSPKDRSSRFF